MAFTYRSWAEMMARRLSGWTSSSTIYGVLEAGSSQYTPNQTHATLEQVFNNGFTELSATGYVRARVPAKELGLQTNNVLLKGGVMNFGVIESGKSVKGMLLVAQMGSSPSATVDVPIMYVTGTGFPFTTDGRQVFISFTDDVYIKLECQTS